MHALASVQMPVLGACAHGRSFLCVTSELTDERSLHTMHATPRYAHTYIRTNAQPTPTPQPHPHPYTPVTTLHYGMPRDDTR